MAVVIETTLGDITVDLYLDQRPVTCLNFLKLCKMKFYNFNLFHSIRSGFIAQTGDPSGEGSGGQSIFGLLEGPSKRFFSGEKMPKIRHTDAGLLSMVCTGDMMVGSQFFFTLGPDLDSLDGVHCVIGEVTEGQDVLRKLNDVICDETHRPYRDVRITHTVVLEDPFNDPLGLRAPSRSPSPSAERLKGGRIAPDEDIDEAQGKTAAELQEIIEEKEAKARATILEIVGDLPDADIAPPENVLFVCKLNPVTTDDDLEIIFSRFGKIVSCEVIRDKKSGDSLQYAFIEFDDKKSCEDAYFKMDNVLIDDRRIHVDFSQSVSKMQWLGKGRGVKYYNEDGKETKGGNRKYEPRRSQSRDRSTRNHQSERNQNNQDDNKAKVRERDRENRMERHHRHERERDSNGKTHRKRSRSRSRLDKPQNERNHYADHGKDTKDSDRRPRDNRTDYHRQDRDRRDYSKQSDSNRNDRRHVIDDIKINDEKRQDKIDKTNDRITRKEERDDRKHNRDGVRENDNRKRNRSEERDVTSERDKIKNHRDSRHKKREDRIEEKKAAKNSTDKYEKSKKKVESDEEIAPRTPSPVTEKVKHKEKSKKNSKHKSRKESKSKRNSSKKRRKPSTSSSDSSSESSSTESSSSSDSNRKKKSSKRRKKKYSTLSTDSSDSSSSSSSSDSSSSSSSDSDVKRKKTKKRTNKKKK